MGIEFIVHSIFASIIWCIISPTKFKGKRMLYWSPLLLKSRILKNIALGFCFWAIGMTILAGQMYYVEKLAALNLSEEAFMLISFPFFFLSLHYFFAKRSLIFILAFGLCIALKVLPNWAVFLFFIFLVFFANGLDKKGDSKKRELYNSFFNSLSFFKFLLIKSGNELNVFVSLL